VKIRRLSKARVRDCQGSPSTPPLLMQLEQLRHHLESQEASRPLLQNWQVRDCERSWRNLTHIATAIGLEALRDLCPALGRLPPRRSPSQREMQEQLQSEVDAAFEDSTVLRVFRRFRQRQTLRIGTNDIIRDRPLEEITRDISRVADAALEVALATALRQVSNRFGQPFANSGAPSRCVILAFGKHGGEELNYSSDIDLMFLYDDEGATRGRRV